MGSPTGQAGSSYFGPTRRFATLHFMSASHSAETTASDGISRMVIAM